MLRRFLSASLIFILCAMNMGVAHGLSNSNSILLYSAKQELIKEAGGSSQVAQISAILPMLETQKLAAAEANIRSVKNNADVMKKHGALLRYLEYAIAHELEIRKKDIQEISIGAEEQQQIQEDILDMQLSLKKEGEKMYQTMMQEFKDISHVSQSGDLKMKLDHSAGDMGTMKLDFLLEDYTSISHNMDYHLQGDLKFELESGLPQAEGNASFGANIDVIYAEGNDYIKLKNIHMYAEGFGMQQEEIDQFITELNTTLSTDSYLRLNSNDQTDFMLDFLANLGDTDHEALLDEIFSKAFFEAYEKNSDGSYSLRPTIDLCHGMKELKNVFDPFHGNSCSQAQYNNMLKDYNDLGAIIKYTPGDDKKITLSMLDGSTQYYSEFLWNDTGLENLKFTSSDRWSGDMTLNFIPRQSISLVFQNELQDLNAQMIGKLSSQGAISELDANVSMGEFMNMQMSYKKGSMDMQLQADIPDLISLQCSANGPLEMDLADVKYSCDFSYNPAFLAFYGISVDEGMDELQLDGEFSYDTRNGNNDLQFSLDAKMNREDYYLYFDIINTGNIKTIPESSKIIVTPNDSIEMDSFFK